MTVRDDSRVRELESSLFVAGLIAQTFVERLDVFDRENAHLRVVAQKVACPYGYRASGGGCMLGYPGCCCMDDIIHATSYPPDTPEEAYKQRLEARVAALGERIRIATNHFRSMAEGFERAREPSKAAACMGMADLMGDRL